MRDPRWFGDVSEPIPLRIGTPIESYSVRHRGDRRLLVMTRARLDGFEARSRMDALCRAHERLEGPHIAPVIDRGEHDGRPWALLGAAVVSEGDELLRTQVDRNLRQPYRAAAGVLGEIVQTLTRCHAVIDRSTGRPYALGALGVSNLYYESNGALWLMGMGDNCFARAATLVPAVLPPEVAVGEHATPASDSFAVSALMRVMVPYVELPPAIARVLRGHDSETMLAQLTHDTNAKLWGLPHAMRPSLARLEMVYRLILSLVGEKMDYAAHRAFVATLLAQDAPEPDGSLATLLELAEDGSWFCVDQGEVQRITTRAALRRVLLCLIENADRSDPCTVATLLDAGWPGERVDPEAGANRVYVAVSTLRRMGLRSVIERFDQGYRLVPSVRVTRKSAVARAR